MTILPPLRVTVSVRCPRSMPRCSMRASAASETRRPMGHQRDQRVLVRAAEPSGSFALVSPKFSAGTDGAAGDCAVSFGEAGSLQQTW